MCGIAGAWAREPGEAPSAWEVDTERMLAALRHRGPDGAALVRERAGVIGAVRLAVIDVDGGAQPMHSSDGRFHLAFNGELVNYVELRERLEREGVRFRTQCDTEVLVELLARRGVDGLAEADGMFAGALLDGESGELVLFRDPYGIKPLYVLEQGDRVLFASEQKAFLAVPGVTRDLHEDALLDYLALQVPLDAETFFRGVRRVQPGTVVRVVPGRAPRTSPLPAWRDEAPVPADPADAAVLLRGRITTSVARHVRSDVPLGTHLSGGVDSSLVLALATQAVGRPLRAFTGGFDVDGFDERPHARAVASELGATLREFSLTPERIAEILPAACAAMDEPMAGPGLLPQWELSRIAADAVTVVLGGQGGDELFGGYARTQLLALDHALAGGGGEPLRRMAPHLGTLSGYGPLMARFFSTGLLDEPAARVLSLVDRRAAVAPLLSADARDRLEAHGVEERFEAAFEAASAHVSGERTVIGDALRFERAHLLPALLQVEDRTSMAWSLESRVPLLGRPILSFVDRLPDAMLLPDGRPRGLLRQAIEADLPAAAAARTDKMGFPVPLGRWAGGPLRAFFRDLLLDGTARSRGLFDSAGVARLLDQDSVTARGLWAAVNVELWLRNDAA